MSSLRLFPPWPDDVTSWVTRLGIRHGGDQEGAIGGGSDELPEPTEPWGGVVPIHSSNAGALIHRFGSISWEVWSLIHGVARGGIKRTVCLLDGVIRSSCHAKVYGRFMLWDTSERWSDRTKLQAVLRNSSAKTAQPRATKTSKRRDSLNRLRHPGEFGGSTQSNWALLLQKAFHKDHRLVTPSARL